LANLYLYIQFWWEDKKSEIDFDIVDIENED